MRGSFYPFDKVNAFYFSIIHRSWFQPASYSDRELSDVVDWDQLSSMADDNDESSSPGPISPFIGWVAEEGDPVDVPASKRNRKRACFSEGSDTDETVGPEN